MFNDRGMQYEGKRSMNVLTRKYFLLIIFFLQEPPQFDFLNVAEFASPTNVVIE
jgi:hypothetical protein